MQQLQLTIPAQDGDHASIRIKPREVKSWLDNLPFLDLQRTARLARKQLHLMNRQRMPAAQRLAMLGDFLATYQRLVEAQTLDRNLRAQLKYLCQDIGFGYKIVTHELANKSSGFMETRHLSLALLGAIHSLGLQLLDCYASYRRAPRALWSECLALYAYAWQHGRETYSAVLPGYGENQIDGCFRLIALLRLADPYRLPAGMALAMRTYFLLRIDRCAIQSEVQEGKNCFQLKEAFQQTARDLDPHLYLEVDELLACMQNDAARLQQYRQAQALGLPVEIPAAALLRSLQQSIVHWQNHPTRTTEREQTHARIELVCGLTAAYCVINQGRCFDPALFLTSGKDQHIDLGAHPEPDNNSVQPPPLPFPCVGINRSSGGLAVHYTGEQQPHPRVGQLIALRRPGPQSHPGWVVAVCRWMVQPEGDNSFELGLQYLTREPRAAVIRVADDAGTSGPFQAAIIATQKRGGQRVHTLITRGGEIHTGTRLTIYEQGRQQLVSCSEQLESGPGFERFLYQPV